jgi:hypothetical protein
MSPKLQSSKHTVKQGSKSLALKALAFSIALHLSVGLAWTLYQEFWPQADAKAALTSPLMAMSTQGAAPPPQDMWVGLFYAQAPKPNQDSTPVKKPKPKPKTPQNPVDSLIPKSQVDSLVLGFDTTGGQKALAMPPWPAGAKEARSEGWAEVRLKIDSTGLVTEIDMGDLRHSGGPFGMQFWRNTVLTAKSWNLYQAADTTWADSTLRRLLPPGEWIRQRVDFKL